MEKHADFTSASDSHLGSSKPLVLIVGAGPTGLTLACQLARFDIPFRIIDRSAHASNESRAFGIQSRTMEIMAQLGLAEAFISQSRRQDQFRAYKNGQLMAQFKLSKAMFPESPFRGLFILPQAKTEAILLDHLAKRHGIQVERQMALREDSIQSEPSAPVTVSLKNLATDQVETAAFFYVVGCDGAKSTVRKIAGLDFEGQDYEQEFLLADCEIETPFHPEDFQIFFSPQGLVLSLPMPETPEASETSPTDGKSRTDRVSPSQASPGASVSAKSASAGSIMVRLMGTRQVGRGETPWSSNLSVEKELEALARDVTAQPFRIRHCTWSSRFHLHHRGVRQYREGRLFVAGDAAHIHSPVGAQGMNTGIQDATNLGWKLAYVIKGWSGENLLDSYQLERHKVGQKILTTTDRFFSFITSRKLIWRCLRSGVLPIAMRVIAHSGKIRRHIFRFMSQTAIRYDEGELVQDVCEKADRRYIRGPAAGTRAPLIADLWPQIVEGSGKKPGKSSAELDPRCVVIHFTDDSNQSLRHREAIKVLVANHSEQLRLLLLDSKKNAPLYETFGVTQTGVFVIRPDGHIGYRACVDSPEPLARYVRALLSQLPVSRPVETTESAAARGVESARLGHPSTIGR